MNTEDVIQATADHVRGLLAGEATGHDWWHIYRVWQNALRIGDREGADLFVVQMAALLHDVDDWKFAGGDEKASGRAARVWMSEQGVSEPLVEQIVQIIDHVSFKGAGVETPMTTIEGCAVQDADRLDALGAIGIARAFAYGARKGNPLFDPDIPVQLHGTFDEYKQSSGTTVNHFYEKLLLLKGRMLTQTGRELAEARHRFMEEYLERFMDEWIGKL